MKTVNVICTTLLIERSPQALPLGAACIASAIKNNPLTKGICTVTLKPFCKEDEEFAKHSTSEQEAAEYIAQQIYGSCGQGDSLQTGASLQTSESLQTEECAESIVCFSVFVWNRIILEQTARILRAKGITCIAGGPEVTANPNSFSDFDYVVCGEGETSVPPLVSRILSGEKIESKVIYKNTFAPAAAETDSVNKQGADTELTGLTSPYLDGTLDPALYEGALWELARGCPFKCSYCYESKGEKKVRQFPMERIEAELDLFARKKIPQVFVLDPTYNANKERALKILNLIAKKTPETFYYFEARAEFIDSQMAKAFTKIPCALQIGLQSANEEVLKLVNRPFNRKQFVRNIGILNNAGVTFGFDLIYGLPGETFKSFKEGIEFAISLYPNNLEIFCLSVLPGTDLFERAQQLNLTYEQQPPYHILHTDKFSAEELKHAERLAKACSIFYNEGCAVPWFNIILHTLKMRACEFLDAFYEQQNLSQKECCNLTQLEIEKMQLEFITGLFKAKHADRFTKVISDIIRYNGAFARRTATGKPQKVQLNYPAEYLESEYVFNLDYFVKNVKVKVNTVTI